MTTNDATSPPTLSEPADAPLRRLGSSAWRWLIAVGIIDAVLGVVILIWPGQSTLVVAIAFGAALLLSGIGSVLMGLVAPLPGWTRALYVVFGILGALLGLVCLRDWAQSILVLGLWIGIGWFFTGLSRLIGGIGVTGSGWTILSGVVMTVAGIVMINSPFTSVPTLVVVSGVLLIISAVVDILHALRVKRLVATP